MAKRFSEDLPNDYEAEEIPFKIRKNLFSTEFEKSPEDEQRMQVFLRIRPLTEEEGEQDENQNCLEVEGEHNVLTHAPKSSHSFKNCAHGLQKTTNKFTFSKIFGQETSQKEFFNGTMLGLVKNFIDGQNCLVFTYGVTSSGKTYTIQGEPRDAGILPRALDVLFNSISNQQLPDCELKPKMFMDVLKLGKEEIAEEIKIKEKTLKLSNEEDHDVMSLLGDDASDASQLTNITTCSESSNMSVLPSKDSLESADSLLEIENRVREETKVIVEDQGQIRFSIWVSFAEIYNEQIFDLLVPIPKKKNARRTVLKLSEDRNGSPYIKGLKEICVLNADEAYKLLTIGKRNLQTACTKLNHQSSRSHCIFNIKIIRVVDKNNPRMARVSMLSLCDLAGSERSAKTQSVGDRLKEAGNINTSLLTLGRCIEMLRYNQHHKDNPKIIPFRDSKLTRLFQNFFCGQGRAHMIVNVNQCASMFDETLHVFKFSAIAKQVVIIQKQDLLKSRLMQSAKKKPDNRAMSICWATPGQLKEMGSAINEVMDIPLPEGDDEDLQDAFTDPQIEELCQAISDLQSKLLAERKEKLRMELKIREEVCNEMMKQLVQIEDDCCERIRLNEEATEEMYEKRIQILMDAMNSQEKKNEFMTDKDDEWVSSLLYYQEQVKVKEKDKEIEDLKKKLEAAETKSMTMEITSSSSSSDDFGNSVLLETLTKQLNEAKSSLKQKDDEIKELNEMLTEAGETFKAKEFEIEGLKQALSEDETKHKEQVTELEKALMESKQMLEVVDAKLKARDKSLAEFVDERKTLQEEIKSQQNTLSFLEATVRQREDDITAWKAKFEREESESFKREQALIHGYKAEITNLKNQLSVAKMGSRHNSPSPCKSPSKHKKDPELSQHFKEDLARQLKDLQYEFDKNSSSTVELEQALHKARMASEDLESRLAVKEEEHLRDLKTNEELKKKYQQTEEKFQQLEKNYEEITTREKLQSEELEMKENTVIDLKKQIREAHQNNYDLENELASKVQENLEVTAEIKRMQELCRSVEHAESPVINLKESSKDSTLKDHGNELDNTNVKLLTEKVEELEVVNAGLRKMLDQTTGEIDQLSSIAGNFTQGNDGTVRNLQKSLMTMQSNMEEMKNENKTLKDNQTELENLSSKCKDLEFQLDEVNIENSELRCENEKLDRKAINLEKLYKEKTKQLMELNDELNKMKVAKEMIEEDLLDQEENSEKIEDMNKEMDSLQEKLLQLEECLTEKESKIQCLEKVTQEIKDELENKTQGFMKTESELKSVQEQYQTLVQQMLVIQSEMAEKQQELVCAVDKMEQIKSQSSETQKENEELQAKWKQASDQNMQFMEQIEMLQGQIDKHSNLHSEVKDAQDKFKEMKDINQSLEVQLKEMGEKSSLIEEKIKECSEKENLIIEKDLEVSALQLKLQDNEKCIEKLKLEQSCISELEAKNRSLQESHVSLQTRIASIQCENDQKHEEISSLEKEIIKLELDMVHTSSELQEKDEHNRKLNQGLSECQMKIDSMESLKNDLEKTKEENGKLMQQLSEYHKTTEDVESMKNDLEKINEENGKLIQELSEYRRKNEDLESTKDDLKKTNEENGKLIQELSEYQKKLEDLDSMKNDLEKTHEENGKLIHELSECHKKLEEIETLKKDLEKEKKENCTSNQELSECQRVIENINSLKKELIDKNEQNWKLNQELSECHRKIENKVLLEKNFEELNEQNCKLNKEISEYQKKIETMESMKNDLEEQLRVQTMEKCASQTPTKQVQNLQKSVVMTSPTVHKELNMSQEREQTLKKQLQNAGAIISELNIKISDLEDQIAELRQELQDAKDKERPISQPRPSLTPSGDIESLQEEMSQKLELIRDLQRDLSKKDTKLQQEKAKVKKLMEERTDEQLRYEAALKDAKANEDCIGVLKSALSDQEELMGQQDQLIQQHEKSIENLQKDCEKYMNMYQSLLSSNNTSNTEIRDLSKKICDLSVENSRLMSEKDALQHTISVKAKAEESLSARLNSTEELCMKLSTEKEKVERELRQIQETLHITEASFQKVKNEKVEMDKNVVSMKEQEAHLKTVKQKADMLDDTLNSLRSVESQLEAVTTESKELQLSLSLVNENLECVRLEKQALEEKLRKSQDTESVSDKKIREMEWKLSDCEIKLSKREVDLRSLREQKMKLEGIISENNVELKDLEKLLSESKNECEKLKIDTGKSAEEQIQIKQAEHDEAITELKIKIREKDHHLRDNNKQIQHLEEELKNVKEKADSKETQMKQWKEEKDKLVESLSKIIEKQKKDKEHVKQLEEEISNLQTEKRRLQSQVEDQVDTINQLTSQTAYKQARLRNSSSSNHDVHDSPPKRPTRRGRKRRSYSTSDLETPLSKKKDSISTDVSLVSDENYDMAHRIQIDATPPVAAKNLRKGRKKQRSSIDLLRESEETKENCKSRRSTRKTNMDEKESNGSLKRIGSLLSVLKKSPKTKSAKKHLQEIKEIPSPNKEPSSPMIVVEDCGTQMSAEKVKETPERKKSRRHALYKEPLQISEPLDCGQFIHTTPEENAHEILQKRLRGRPRKK